MHQESAESINPIAAMSWLDVFGSARDQEAEFSDSLIAGALAGHAGSIETLLREYHGPVFRICLRMMGNREDAQDAAQDSLMRMLDKLSAYDTGRAFMPWLYALTLNVCRDHLRKRKRHQTESIDVVKKEVVTPRDDLRREVALNDELRILEEALQTLPTKERAAVVLRDIEGLSTAEVAEVMGTRETTVRSHISRARTKLKLYRDRIRKDES